MKGEMWYWLIKKGGRKEVEDAKHIPLQRASNLLSLFYQFSIFFSCSFSEVFGVFVSYRPIYTAAIGLFIFQL